MTASNWVQAFPTPDCYWMSRILYDIHHQASHLERYRTDPDAYMAEFPLAPTHKAAIRDNDIGAMYLQGVNPLLLRAHCLGLRIPEADFVASLRRIQADGKEADHG